MKIEKIMVKGMKDQKDVDQLTAGLHDVWGVRRVDVSLVKGTAEVSFDEQAASLDDFKQAILDEGFQVEGQ